jgi:hypothetical protein
MLDAQSYQNAGNAVLEYTTSTRDFRPIDGVGFYRRDFEKGRK